ncbi:glutaredoxin family protein [Dokdonella soli]|uniref:Glutaredoxin domain-containing protein n=1 Tax=Dokdonella soli TaxID=529810 RepID=A0ABN1ICA5_9GAMM
MLRRLLPALSIALAFAALAACTRAPSVDQTTLRTIVGNEPVVLLSASWCGYCRKLRTDLKQWGVHYREYDIENSTAGTRAFALLKGSGVPILLVGERRFHGYVPRQIHTSLRDAGLAPASAAR